MADAERDLTTKHHTATSALQLPADPAVRAPGRPGAADEASSAALPTVSTSGMQCHVVYWTARHGSASMGQCKQHTGSSACDHLPGSSSAVTGSGPGTITCAHAMKQVSPPLVRTFLPMVSLLCHIVGPAGITSAFIHPAQGWPGSQRANAASDG